MNKKTKHKLAITLEILSISFLITYSLANLCFASQIKIEMIDASTSCGINEDGFSANNIENSISIDFRNLISKANVSEPRNRLNCLITFKVSSSDDQMIAIENLAINGHVSIPEGGRSQLTIRYYPIGESGHALLNRFNEIGEKDFSINTDWPKKWLPCRSSFTLGVMIDITTYLENSGSSETSIEENQRETTLRVTSINIPPIQIKQCDPPPPTTDTPNAPIPRQ